MRPAWQDLDPETSTVRRLVELLNRRFRALIGELAAEPAFRRWGGSGTLVTAAQPQLSPGATRNFVVCNTTAGAFTVIMPPSRLCHGTEWVIRNSGSPVNTLTIRSFEGATLVTLAGIGATRLWNDQGAWWEW